MIHVDRPVRTPDRLALLAPAALRDLEGFFAEPLEKRIQRTPKFHVEVWHAATSDLEQMFHGKCAFCETRPFASALGTEHFRPKLGAVGLDRKSAPDHYWWLAYEWSNLLPVCERCNHNKGNRFPVEGERAPERSTGEALLAERPLLIDPCLDDPNEHLVFGETGRVSPRSRKGEITVEVLQLNRDELVKERRHAIGVALSELSMITSAGRYSHDAVERLLAPHHTCAGARRQAILRYLREHPAPAEREIDAGATDDIIALASAAAPFISSAEEETEALEFTARQVLSEAPAAPAEVKDAFLFGKSQYISRVEIVNFRVIQHLDLEFAKPESGAKPWLVLLGENGVGKSTVLKAVALALMDPQSRRKLRLKPAHVLRHGERDGAVRVHLAGYTRPFELTFARGDPEFGGGSVELRTPLLGYGGTRLPARRHRATATQGRLARADNLFNPFLPLVNSRGWLLSLEEERFGFTARAIKRLLMQDDDEAELRRTPAARPRRVDLVAPPLREAQSLEHLSDGYRSVVALAADIMQTTFLHWDTVEDAEGVVLIDEIDVHLHPRWKVQIVDLLRRVFPRVQFLITTHDPLCLLGTRTGEVHVMRTHPQTGQVVADQVDVPQGATADHLLTGFWFGLRSTTDRATLALLDQHRRLLREGTAPTDPRRLQLEAQLRLRLGTFADTSVDRMAQSVAAQLIQEDYRELRDEDRSAIRTKILDLVKQKAQSAPG